MHTLYNTIKLTGSPGFPARPRVPFLPGKPFPPFGPYEKILCRSALNAQHKHHTTHACVFSENKLPSFLCLQWNHLYHSHHHSHLFLPSPSERPVMMHMHVYSDCGILYNSQACLVFQGFPYLLYLHLFHSLLALPTVMYIA